MNQQAAKPVKGPGRVRIFTCLRGLRVTTLLVACGVAPVRAQEPAFPEPGDRVRVTVEAGVRHSTGEFLKIIGSARFTARLLEADSENLLLRTDEPEFPQPQTVALDRIERLQLARPRSRGEGARHGAFVGTVTGVAFGAFPLVWALVSDEPYAELGYISAGLLVGLGAGAGALIGVMAPGEEWITVRIESR